MIEVRNLVKEYGEQTALHSVSFTVRPGEAVGYVGPNGAGKSTTVKLLAGLLQPTSGQILICGHDLRQEPLEAKRRLGYVPETAALYTTLTAHEYLSLVAELYHLDQDVAAQRIRQLMHAFALTDAVDRQIETLSKGMRQKVLLAAALLHDPDVILLDEPFSGLDVNAALSFRRILETLIGRGKTILFSSHVLAVVERLCARVMIIDQGKILADDTTTNLLAGHPDGTLEAVFQSLTRSAQADEWVQSFLAALENKPAATVP